MTETRRLDAELVHRGLARSRGEARDLVVSGCVVVDGTPARRASQSVQEGALVEVRRTSPPRVSRAGGKLAHALHLWGPLGLRVEGRRCLDVGASTGGFTEVLLEAGAEHVLALDVGHGQLVASLAEHPRVTERSGLSIRDAEPGELGAPFGVVVADLSFISLTLVLDRMASMCGADSDVVLLVKPQFEVGKTRLGKGGLVHDAAHRADALVDVTAAALAVGLGLVALERSPVVGTHGNIEYLLWAVSGPSERMDRTMDRAALDRRVADVTREGPP